MPMHYRHPEDGEKPCRCPRCGWSGTLHQSDEFTPNEGGESFQVCPRCGPEVPVIPDQNTPRQQLRARYPAILERASLSYGDGWAGIMETLCERLQFHAEHNGMPPVEITQAKEKFGELVVLFRGGDRYAGGLIDMAEALSAHVCELCGNPGTLQDGPAFRTRCVEHVDTRLSDYLKTP